MSYGVALRNGVPFTLGTIAALCVNATSQWSPLALWPNGAASPGMWIDPSLLTASFNDSAGTTPVSVPGSVADSANPVGLALDIRAGATALAGPGHHMLQATSAARPVASARVNLLTYSDDFSNAAWGKNSVSISAASDPAGGSSATKLTANAAAAEHYVTQNIGNTNTRFVHRVVAKAGGYSFLGISATEPGLGQNLTWFNLATGAVGTNAADNTPTITSLGDGWYECIVKRVHINDYSQAQIDIYVSNADNVESFTGDGSSGIYVYQPQLQVGESFTRYQRVGAASDYTATGFPQYLKFDGADDVLSSATFSAGTLTSSMDCLIAVRRDSAAMAIVGPYQAAGDATKFIGVAESGSPYLCVGIGAGAPTVFVDGAQLTGGTAVTFGTLHTALTPGAWHIVEFRGLNLSTWTALALGAYGSGYDLNGALGGIQLFASGQDANRNQARAQMAAYFGVTLP